MPLTITLREQTSIPLEVDAVNEQAVRGRPLDEVRRILVQYGNRQVPLADFFDVEGATDDDETVWRGDCSRVKLIGARLSGGRVRVEGNAGMHCGAEMTGGEVLVTGNAGDWAGAEMHGGRLIVHGSAGHLVGAGYRGSRRGMTGGEILVHGDAGNEIGATIRRGLIAIGGRSGDAAGFNMIAGSIFLFGETGIRFGAGMSRGTIALFSDQLPELLPTFRYACTYRPVFLRAHLLHLQRNGFPVDEAWLEADYRRYCGDFVDKGRGEILLRSAV